MSRAFTNSDAPGEPPVVPPRAPLPDGVPNYVTPRGLKLLRDEQDTLQAERKRLSTEGEAEDTDRQRALEVVNARLTALTERLARIQLVDPERQQDAETVRFGASVTVAVDGEGERRFQIVGVDEADAAEERVAFTAPVARVVNGKKAGETATLRTPEGEKTLTVVAVAYEAA